MADTLAAQVSALTQSIIEATIMQMPQNAPLMNIFEKIDIPNGRNAALIPRANTTFTVAKPTEGDEIVTNNQFTLTSTTISPTLRVIKCRISERAKYFSQQDILRLISQELSRAEGQDLDTDLSAQFVNFGQTAGTTDTDLTLGVLRTSRQLLMSNSVANGGPAPDPISVVLAPLVVEHLLTNVGVQGAVSSTNPWIPAGLSEDFIKEYLVQGVHLVGVPIFWDGYLTVNGSTDFICAMASKQALQYAVSKEWDMRTFEESNWVGPILRAVADYASGVGKYSRWGVAITADGS